MALATPEPPPAEKPQSEIRTFSFVPRLGFMATGSGTLEQKCSGGDCGTVYTYTDWPIFYSGTSSADYDHKPAIAIGADFMFKLGDIIRIGPGLMHTFNMSIKPDGASNDMDFGSLTDINFVFEVIPRVSPTVWLVPRAQLGVSMLTPSGDFDRMLKSYKDYCNSNSDVFSGCDTLGGPFFGVNVGLGFGAMFAVSPSVRLRVDSMYQYYTINGWNVKVSGGDANATSTVSGGRGFLMGGVEF
jgi:hypothetical protein